MGDEDPDDEDDDQDEEESDDTSGYYNGEEDMGSEEDIGAMKTKVMIRKTKIMAMKVIIRTTKTQMVMNTILMTKKVVMKMIFGIEKQIINLTKMTKQTTIKVPKKLMIQTMVKVLICGQPKMMPAMNVKI